MQKLTDDQVKAKLSKLPDWSFEDGRLHITLGFSSFSEAFSIMTQIALEAQALNHHPDEMFIRGSEIGFDLMTHDANGVTEKDFELAFKINALVNAE